MLPESKLSSFLQELADECEANRDSIPPEPAEKQFLFEGQLSNDDPATVSHSLQGICHLFLICLQKQKIGLATTGRPLDLYAFM